MSPPGPPPKRTAERRRRNAPAAGEAEQVDVEALAAAADPNSLPFLIAQPIVIPEPVTEDNYEAPGKGWHPLALEFWESIKRSGQAIYYEPSDWVAAKLLCESLSRDLKPQVVGIAPATEFGPAEVVTDVIPLKGASLAAYLKAFGQLMLTEGERRRMAIELQRHRSAGKPKGDAKVVKITDRKRALAAVDSRKAAAE